MEMYLIALVILAALAVSDLIVGVSNDAVNFLNSAIGSRVAPRNIILLIASLGMLMGVMFASGMMEVARSGIFHPQYFNMPELMAIFLSVMLTDVILLDIYNTFGLPTSTTVSIVFSLMGASITLSIIKINQLGETVAELPKYINTGKSLFIIFGILVSVVIAFFFGTVVQFLSRLLFSFDFQKRLRRYGALWGGAALCFILYFILVKGAKGSALLTHANVVWIQTHTWTLMLYFFVACAVMLQLIIFFTKINILKPIVLLGTFALALAFAANDLVNFIGVPMAGLSAYQAAQASGNSLTASMNALLQPSEANTFFLLISGLVMGLTVWISKKARTVTDTELNLGRQDEGFERYGSSPLSRAVVRVVATMGDGIKRVIPDSIINKINQQFKASKTEAVLVHGGKPSFDLVRAAVNLMVSSALISLGTSMKLPLSTTYVTFMVAMGSSFADRAWGRDSAVFRVSGVLLVIGGWFLTAFTAFTFSSIFSWLISHFHAIGLIGILFVGAAIMLNNVRLHRSREQVAKNYEIYNLKKIKDDQYAIGTTFEHTGLFLKDVRENLANCYIGLATQNRTLLKSIRRETRKVQEWANIIIANVFKTIRLLSQEEMITSQKYAQTVGALQEIAECHRDAIKRIYTHIDNNHEGMLPVQLEELAKVNDLLLQLLASTANAMMKKEIADCSVILAKRDQMAKLVVELDKNQITRIKNDVSKTRLSILFYGFLRDARIIAEQAYILLEIFQDSFNQECQPHKEESNG